MGGFPSSFGDNGGGHKYAQGWSIALVGAPGSGKSATGNSILGRKAFRSGAAVTTSVCDLQTAVLEDGHILHVIDTPGLSLESCGTYDVTQINIAQFINTTTTGGINAVVLVVSVRDKFTEDDKAAFAAFYYVFGRKLSECVILVFTGGDELRRRNRSLDDYLSSWDCPQPLKDILKLYGKRKVLFNNETPDESERDIQVKRLVTLVRSVVMRNGGKPYKPAYPEELLDETERSMMLDSLIREFYTLQTRGRRNSQDMAAEKRRGNQLQPMSESEVPNNNLEERLVRLEKGLEESNGAVKKLRDEFGEFGENHHRRFLLVVSLFFIAMIIILLLGLGPAEVEI